jgi:hypothetical protein
MWSAPPAELDRAGRATFRVGVLITNRSPVIARDVYVNVTVFTPGGESTIGVEFPDLQNWSGTQAFGHMTQILCKDTFRLAPKVLCQPLILAFSLAPPFHERLSLTITTGCAGSPIKEVPHRLAPEELERLYVELAANRESVEARRRFVQRIIGAPTEDPDGG